MRLGNFRQKQFLNVGSTSLVSCGEALATQVARGKPWPSARAMTLVPLPRFVGPTARPLFLNSRRSRPGKSRKDPICRVYANPRLILEEFLERFLVGSTAEIVGDTSDRVDIAPVNPSM